MSIKKIMMITFVGTIALLHGEDSDQIIIQTDLKPVIKLEKGLAQILREIAQLKEHVLQLQSTISVLENISNAHNQALVKINTRIMGMENSMQSETQNIINHAQSMLGANKNETSKNSESSKEQS